jgi:hypothetical protein
VLPSRLHVLWRVDARVAGGGQPRLGHGLARQVLGGGGLGVLLGWRLAVGRGAGQRTSGLLGTLSRHPSPVPKRHFAGKMAAGCKLTAKYQTPTTARQHQTQPPDTKHRTRTLSRAASTESGELPGRPSFSASRATRGTAISQKVVMPSRPPSDDDAARMPCARTRAFGWGFGVRG